MVQLWIATGCGSDLEQVWCSCIWHHCGAALIQLWFRFGAAWCGKVLHNADMVQQVQLRFRGGAIGLACL